MREGTRASQRRSSANRGFIPVVVLSLFVHTFAIGAIVYGQSHRPRLDVTRSAIPVQLVALGKRRDPALLPRKVAEEAPPPPETQGVALDLAKSEAEKEKAAQEKPRPTQEPRLSDRAKRLLEAKESPLDRALTRLEEREGDPEGSAFGKTTDGNAAAGYQREIMVALQQSYKLPETIPPSQRGFLKARVVLFIEPDGRIARFEFIETHPNTNFMSALETLLRTIKLPRPPPSQAAVLKEAGVEVIFRP